MTKPATGSNHSAGGKGRALFFRRALRRWARTHDRSLPWKKVKDPYVIWLSEIILQQTRVQQGLPYFEKFVKKYPRLRDLAAADEDEVLKLWQGLGYYSRARNMLATARHIVSELDGRFPQGYDSLLKLKGIGPYTAAAIASFAFGEPTAVVDGNVKRVISRYFGITAPAGTANLQDRVSRFAAAVLDPVDPGAHNQAIMDFGARLCVPRRPVCPKCPMSPHCRAYQHGTVDEIPAPDKRIQRRRRYFNYLVILTPEGLVLRKRTGKDIWRHLYEMPLIEGHEFLSHDQLMKTAEWGSIIGERPVKVMEQSVTYRQALTHQEIYARFMRIYATGIGDGSFVLANPGSMDKFAFPRVIDRYLKEWEWKNV